MSTPTDRQAFEARFLELLSQHRLRTAELLAAANVTDRRAGEDAVWSLVQRGRVVIGPDSTLRLTSDGTAPKKKRTSNRVTEEAR